MKNYDSVAGDLRFDIVDEPLHTVLWILRLFYLGGCKSVALQQQSKA